MADGDDGDGEARRRDERFQRGSATCGRDFANLLSESYITDKEAFLN